MMAAVLAVLASAQVAAATDTVRQYHRGGQPGARVEDVVQRGPAAPPAPGGGAGRGQPAVPDGHHRRGSGRRVLRPPGDVLHPDPPAAVWWLTGDRDVPAQAHQHSAAQRAGQPGGRAVRGPRLGGGAEVQAHPGGQGEQPARLVEAHLAPAGRGPHGQPDRRPVGRHQREVAVVADGGEGIADGRIDVAVGQLGRAQRDRHRLGEQRAELHRPGLAFGSQEHQLGVGPEPAAGGVHGGEIRRQQAAAVAELGRVGDQQPDLGAQRGPVR